MKQNLFKSVPSAVKSDPYSNKTHRRIDIVLIALTLILIFFAFRYSAHSRTHVIAAPQQHSQSNH